MRMSKQPPKTGYPFSAVVGQQLVKLSLLLNAVSPRVGGVLIQGEKGNGKSTAVRALAELLPLIPVVPGCPTFCDPAAPFSFCPACEGRPWPGEPELRPAPFVELPIGASDDRLLGHMSLDAALSRGEYSFTPGLLARAHRGILYVDEINLLPDHLIDMLLDAAASGRNRVEREGFSVEHPARFILVGTMNPEEGELRPQLLDRFGLSVHVETPQDVASRTEVMRRRQQYECDPVQFRLSWSEEEAGLQQQVGLARQRLLEVELPDVRLEQIARLCLQAKTEGMRADLVLCEASKAIAAYRGHTLVTAKDVNEAAPLALHHRSRDDWQPEPPDDDGDETESGGRQGDDRQNGEPPGGHPNGQSNGESNGQPDSQPNSQPNSQSSGHPPGQRNGRSGGEGSVPESTSLMSSEADEPPIQQRQEKSAGKTPASRVIPEQLLPIDSRFRVLPGDVQPSARSERVTATKSVRTANTTRARSTRSSVTHMRLGRPIRSRRITGGRKPLSLDWPNTLRSCIVRAKGSPRLMGAPLQPTVHDLFERVYLASKRRLHLFLLDASGSMAGYERMSQAKSLVMSIVEQVYPQRDRFAIIAFRKNGAELLLAPSANTRQAKRALEQLPSGGATPLAAGLERSIELFRSWKRREPGAAASLYVLTDGKLKPGSGADLAKAAAELSKLGADAVVIDTEWGRIRLGMARKLAQSLGAAYKTLDA